MAERSSKSPFGKESRREILTRHFAQHPVSIDRAWEFIYRELLWIDGSTGLAHLYESDKAQPGRSVWYDRTVKFTDLLCHEFDPLQLLITRLTSIPSDRIAIRRKADELPGFQAVAQRDRIEAPDL